MIVNPDTTLAVFTQTEREWMAAAITSHATHIRSDVRDYTQHHRRNLSPEDRELRLLRAATLERCAQDFLWGERT